MSPERKPERAKRRLLLPLSVIFTLIVMMQLFSLWVLDKVTAERQFHQLRVAVSANQRLTVEQFERSSYLATVGLATNNLELLVEQRLRAKELADLFAATNRAIQHGGTTHLAGAAIALSPIRDAALDRLLEETGKRWSVATTSQVRLLRSNNHEIQGNKDLLEFRDQTRALTGILEQAHERIVALGEARNRWFEIQQWTVPIAACALTVLLAFFVYRKIVRPLFDSMHRAELSARALDEKNRAMRLVLDNVDQGFATIDASGNIIGERSASFDAWFASPGQETPFADALGTLDQMRGQTFALGWEMVRDDVLPRELAFDQLPKEVTSAEDRHLALAYKPLTDADVPERTLLVITDRTAEVLRARAEEEQQQFLAVFEHIMRDRQGFKDFFDEADRLVAVIFAPETGDLEFQRAVHTLKGSGALFGLEALARACHEVEERMAEERRRPQAAELEPLRAQWLRSAARIRGLLGEEVGTVFTVSRVELEHAITELARNDESADLIRFLQSWQHEPVRGRLERFGDQTKALAKRLGKGDIKVVVEDDGVRLPPDRWAGFWSAFVHVLRNAVDHGIESPEHRAETGKPDQGTVRIRVWRETDAVSVEVEDDGQGVQWAQLREKAERKGLPHSGSEELLAAMFADGISTRDEVTATSGRGIGMGAARAAAEAMGGRISVTSTPHVGTRIKFKLPSEHGKRTRSEPPNG